MKMTYDHAIALCYASFVVFWIPVLANTELATSAVIWTTAIAMLAIPFVYDTAYGLNL